MSKQIDIDQLREKTKLAREKGAQTHEKNFELVYQKAFDKVIENYQEKIDESTNRGFFRAYLYVWYYVPANDPRYTFNGVRMLDIVTKGDLITRLQKYFNPNGDEEGLTVGWHKFKNPGTGPRNGPINGPQSKYGIYISWQKPEDMPPKKDDNSSKDETTPTEQDETEETTEQETEETTEQKTEEVIEKSSSKKKSPGKSDDSKKGKPSYKKIAKRGSTTS